MMQQSTLDGQLVKSAEVTIRTDDGGVIRMKVSGTFAKRLIAYAPLGKEPEVFR